MNDKDRIRRNIHYAECTKAYTALMKFYPLTIDNLDGEEWRDISGYEGLYQISSFGRVKSTNRRKTHILKPVLASNGYLHFCLSKGGVHNPSYVARLVAKAFIPNPDNKPQVNHIDGHPLNNFVGNLEWATQSENQRHAYATGLQVAPQGEKRLNAKLTNADVEYVRANPDNLTRVQLAKKFNVSKTIIRNVMLGETYKLADGEIHQPKFQRVPECIRREIRQLYKPYSREVGTVALAKKFGYSPATIWYIVNELD